jgi:hypothetical protein
MGVKPGLTHSGKNTRLMVHENSVLRRIYEPKRSEITRRWRRLHNEELHQSLYFSADIIRVNK